MYYILKAACRCSYLTSKEDKIQWNCADAVLSYVLLNWRALQNSLSYPYPYKQAFLKLMQPTRLKGVAGKLTRMGGDSNMVIVFPSIFHQSGLLEGKEDI